MMLKIDGVEEAFDIDEFIKDRNEALINFVETGSTSKASKFLKKIRAAGAEAEGGLQAGPL